MKSIEMLQALNLEQIAMLAAELNDPINFEGHGNKEVEKVIQALFTEIGDENPTNHQYYIIQLLNTATDILEEYDEILENILHC